MTKRICLHCFEDEHLRGIVEAEGRRGNCDACNSTRCRRTITVNRLGQLLAGVLRENIAPGEYVPHFTDNDREDYVEQEGDDLDYFVQEVLGQYFDFNDEIIDAVVDADDYDPREGDIPFFEISNSYVAKQPSDREYRLRWQHLQHVLKSERRFFDPQVTEFFEELFRDIDSLRIAGIKESGSVVRVVEAGTVFFRSRVCDSFQKMEQMYKEPFRNVGPPPADKAKAGRMNPEGIPMFYASLDPETCRSELRPALGGESVTIGVETTESLRVLDFTRLPRGYKTLSYFQPDFAEQGARLRFLRRLGKQISRPVIPGRESEYLITQTMMEYLAYVHRQPFDGVFFASAQRQSGTNVVLFPKRDDAKLTFPIKYKDGSINAFETVAIEYKHEERRYILSQDGLEPDWWYHDIPEDDS